MDDHLFAASEKVEYLRFKVVETRNDTSEGGFDLVTPPLNAAWHAAVAAIRLGPFNQGR
nr:hypothetical protein [Novosphingobium indicum]